LAIVRFGRRKIQKVYFQKSTQVNLQNISSYLFFRHTPINVLPNKFILSTSVIFEIGIITVSQKEICCKVVSSLRFYATKFKVEFMFFSKLAGL